MSNSLSPLMFTVGLIDQISGPAGRASQSFDDLVGNAQSGFQKITSGAMGLAGAGYMIYEGLTPAIEMNRALADVKSAGVQDDALKQLNDTSLELSSSYGLVASEVANSGAQISRSVKGLSGDELSSFTSAAGVLASSTKTGMEDTSLYITQMYERFKGTADSMGKAQWVEQLVGQTSYLKKELGTNATDIADAMQGLNNLGTGLGVGMNEQLAIMATLSKSTGIADAEAQYTNFLEYAVSAQDKLGMSFTDSNGKLLPMLDILGKLQTEFGDLSGADTWAVLDDAFGDGSKLIQQLSKDTVGLGKTINDLGNIKGMDQASKMAESMVDPWQQLGSGVKAVTIAFGQALLPAIEPVIDFMANMAKEILFLIKLFPNITKVLGITAITILALTAGMAALTIAVGVGQAASSGWLMIMKLGAVVTKAITRIQWLLNAAFIANPIGLYVLAFIALIAVLYAVWQGLKLLWAMFADTSAGQFMIEMVGNIVEWFKSLGSVVDFVIDKLNMIPGVDITTSVEDVGEIPGINTGNNAGEVYNIPGLNTGITAEAMNVDIPYRKESIKNDVPGEGVTKQISKSISDNSSKQTSVTINSSQPMTPSLMNEYLLMEGA